ncbi:uncharacterized protein LOC122378759 [Amphibalanus amphitrite]|uniref:uncharacterized protein LOC122378759 n=1 Tax=Amphibalanus amphitrite TaxID=1232801 RepID=UPI001C901706|nr:uncharacterized protein LOC122378759 [Amphibalanus amphitrite]
MAIPARGRTLPPLKGSSRQLLSPTGQEITVPPSSARGSATNGTSGEQQSASPPTDQKDEQSVPSSNNTQEEAQDVDDVKTADNKKGSALSKLMSRFKRKKLETTKKGKGDEKTAEKDSTEAENQPEGIVQRVW